jgi:hypothetical protein
MTPCPDCAAGWETQRSSRPGPRAPSWDSSVPRRTRYKNDDWKPLGSITPDIITTSVIASACQLHNDPICNPRPIQTAVRLNAQIGGAPVTAGTETPTASRLSRFFRRYELVSPVAWMVIEVPWRLRHPRRLTVLAIAAEAPNVVFSVLRAARAVQRRRPRMAAGSALLAAGSVARLRAASAEPLR